MALSVIHGDTIDGDVDTCAIRSAYTKCRITDSRPRIRGGECGRSHTQQVRDILSEVHLFKFGFAYIGKCYGSFCCSTGGYYLHLLQVDYFQTV